MSANRTDRSKRVSFAPSPPRPSPTKSRSSTTSRSSTSNNSSRRFDKPHPLPTPAWPFNEHDTILIGAGYQPQWTPEPKEPGAKPAKAEPKPETKPQPKGKGKKTADMAEPRARMARHKGQMNFQNERTSFAYNKRNQQSPQLTYSSSSSAPRIWRPKSPPVFPK